MMRASVKARRCRHSRSKLFFLLMFNASFLTQYIILFGYHVRPLYSLADDAHEEDDLLTEILAEQAQEEDELGRLEAEAREFDAIKYRHQSVNSGDNGMQGDATSKQKMGRFSSYSKLEEDLRKKESENASKKSTQEETQPAQDAERIRIKRERAFEAELKKMNKEQRKKAMRQKKKDAKVVKRILKAHQFGKHYSVLGIRNFELRLGPFFILNFSFGPFILFRVKTKEIKRAYRNLARTVHPDKNKDGRAEEAFHSLETSADILTNEKQRSDYDKRMRSSRRRRNKYAMESFIGAGQMAWKRSISTLRVAKRVLGPFSTPILVISALIL